MAPTCLSVAQIHAKRTTVKVKDFETYAKVGGPTIDGLYTARIKVGEKAAK